jgi:hypothetical protein
MGHQIVQQPDGKYAIWSSNTDGFIAVDATREEILDYYADRGAKRAREENEVVFEQLAKGEKPYYQFTKTWDQMLADRVALHQNEPDFKDALSGPVEPFPQPSQLKIDYDDDPDTILSKVEKALEKAGVEVTIKCDGLDHDGYNIYVVRKGK